MKKSIALLVTATVLVLGCFMAVQAEEMEYAPVKITHNMPTESIVSLVAGKTLDVRLTGYGWGDTVDTLSLDFTVTDPIVFAAADIEVMEAGEIISTGMDAYTVKTIEKTDDAIRVVPEEEWLTPVTLTRNDNGDYLASNDDGEITVDSFSFGVSLSPNLVYVNTAGETLTALELMTDLSKEAFDPYSTKPKATFDDKGYLVELNFVN